MFIWTISDAISIVALALVALVFLAVYGKTVLSQVRCKHDGSVHETSACDAICAQCGKNLGFIGAWRERSQAQENKHG